MIATLPSNIARLGSTTQQILQARLIAEPAPPSSPTASSAQPDAASDVAPVEARVRAKPRARASEDTNAHLHQDRPGAPDPVPPEPTPEPTQSALVPDSAPPADGAAPAPVTAFVPEFTSAPEPAPVQEIATPEPAPDAQPLEAAPVQESPATEATVEATPSAELAAEADVLSDQAVGATSEAAPEPAAEAVAPTITETAAKAAAVSAAARAPTDLAADQASTPPRTYAQDVTPAAAQASPTTLPDATPDPAPIAAPAPASATPNAEQLAHAPESSGAIQQRPIVLPKSMEVDYVLRRSEKGLDLGRMKLSWTLEDQHYTLTTVAEAAGLLALFMPGKHLQVSKGLLTDAGLAPQQFREERTDKADHIDTVQFDRANGRLVYSGRSGEKSLPLPEGTQDILSFLMQFAIEPPRSGSVASSITTGRKLENFTYEIAGKETLRLAGEAVETLRLTPKDAKGRNSIELWLAIDRHHFPVKLRVVDRKGNIVEQIATRIRVE